MRRLPPASVARSFTLLLLSVAVAQDTVKRPVTHEDYDAWRSIAGTTVSRDGQWIAYALTPQDGDSTLEVRSLEGTTVHRHPRGTEPRFTTDGKFVVFTIQPPKSEVKAYKLKKLKEAKNNSGGGAGAGAGGGEAGAAGGRRPGAGAAPAGGGGARRGGAGGGRGGQATSGGGAAGAAGAPDPNEPKPSLAILDLGDGTLSTVPRSKGFQVPQEGPAFVVYQVEKEEKKEDAAGSRPESRTAESSEKEEGEAPASRRSESSSSRPGSRRAAERDPLAEKRKDGQPLFVRNLTTGQESRIEGVVSHGLTRKKGWLWYSLGMKKDDPKIKDGAYALELATGRTVTLLTGPGDYASFGFDREVTRMVFLSNTTDLKAEKPTHSLYAWDFSAPAAELIASHTSTRGFPQGRSVSTRRGLTFSKDGNVLLFGAGQLPEKDAPPQLEDDKVTLDLWHWQDGMLQPMQSRRAEDLRNRAIDCAWHFGERRFVVLGDKDLDNVTLITPDGSRAIAHDESPYLKQVSWDSSHNDVYLINTQDGNRQKILTGLRGNVSASPGGRWLTWFGTDRHWHSMDVATRTERTLTANLGVAFFAEDWDQPSPARSHGVGGWLKDDAALLLYDQYDVWKVAPDGSRQACITDGYGRANHLEFRAVRLDPEQDAVDPARPLLLSASNDDTKASGYYEDTLDGVEKPRRLVMLDKSIGGLQKPQLADKLVFTVSTFAEFPDLWVAGPGFSGMRRLSEANPQQKSVRWGNAELCSWTNGDGVELKGILIKPEGFDPKKKYPMLISIYEKLSEGLHRYQAPAPGTSPNASYYVSNGYLWFAPDIIYEVGYPGESCLKCVVPGVQSLIAKGFVDENAIAISGHSWGGYQTAYLITRTDLFKCVESGAPVCNMVSAYGGIRYSTGMSREFQYEKTQSRIGQTLWEAPLKYIENSPIFRADKVRTPILMLHNDQDGAVPWTQGIEYFTALRRLNKEAYLFNYVGEDHGLRRRANMKDWTVRMQEYFDHHLRGAPAPKWMREGVAFVDRDKEKLRNQKAEPQPISVETENEEKN